MSDDNRRLADATASLAHLTTARIALGRVGSSMTSTAVLALGAAHARARAAVHTPLDVGGIAARLASAKMATVAVSSTASTREMYLQRPDRGRRLAHDSEAALSRVGGPFDVVVVVADGLSPAAVDRHAVDLALRMMPQLAARGLSLAPVIVATQARVALGDHIAQSLGARLVLVLIGERPGLTSIESLGAYLTFAPGPATHDAQRNCVSNIRPEGLTISSAAMRLEWLIVEALRIGCTGIMLKDGSDGALASERRAAIAKGPD